MAFWAGILAMISFLVTRDVAEVIFIFLMEGVAPNKKSNNYKKPYLCWFDDGMSACVKQMTHAQSVEVEEEISSRPTCRRLSVNHDGKQTCADNVVAIKCYPMCVGFSESSVSINSYI
ncbi:hypothetical protein TNCV_590361 [Trichonephila clavipes]|nr:hypothetical protein TNCV_590361 [Trichonephila clavipes]